MRILKDEFLDENYVIDSHFTNILEKKPSYDEDFLSTKLYISEIQSYLHDLKENYVLDFLDSTSSGFKLASILLTIGLKTIYQY